MKTFILIFIVYQTTGAAGCRCPSSYPWCGNGLTSGDGWCYKSNGDSHYYTTNCGGGFGSSCTISYSSVSSSGSPPPPSPSPPPPDSSSATAYDPFDDPYNSYDDDDGGGGGLLGGVSSGAVIFFLVVAVGLFCWCKHKGNASGSPPRPNSPDIELALPYEAEADPVPDPDLGAGSSAAGRQTKRRNWRKSEIEHCWNQAEPIPGREADADVIRQDVQGNPIRKSRRGPKGGDMGWEVDHIKPVAKGGRNAKDNLQALQWKANRQKGDQWDSSDSN